MGEASTTYEYVCRYRSEKKLQLLFGASTIPLSINLVFVIGPGSTPGCSKPKKIYGLRSVKTRQYAILLKKLGVGAFRSQMNIRRTAQSWIHADDDDRSPFSMIRSPKTRELNAEHEVCVPQLPLVLFLETQLQVYAIFVSRIQLQWCGVRVSRFPLSTDDM